MRREQKKKILKDLQKKMVFLSGPRQVGKTWLAKDLTAGHEPFVYLNFDDPDHQSIIKKREWLPETKLLVFDELHKMKGWKNYLKGLYDTKPKSLQILVTGSARLETFRYSGDSLAGRYFLHRLLPFALFELEKPTPQYENLLIERGGFPEPFLADSEDEAQRWRHQYIQGLVRIDILDFERLHDLKAVQLTLELLRSRVGASVSYQSLAEDVGVSLNTIKKYIQIFEELFIVFRVFPFSKNIARSIRKEAKIYFYDTGMVKGDEGAKFENYVAISLLKFVFLRQDQAGAAVELNYLRTKEKKEVDFCLTVDHKPKKIIEAKLSDSVPSPSLRYFFEKYKIPAVQLVKNLSQSRLRDGIEVRSSFDFLKDLPHIPLQN